MPEFQTFLTPENMDTLFYNLKWVLYFAAPSLMIYIAILTVGKFIDLLKGSFSKDDEKYWD